MSNDMSPFQGSESLEVQSWRETAKKARIDSLSTGREFSKSMISLSAGAIPVYLALLKLVLPDSFKFSSWGGLVTMLPAFLFLFGVILFAIAYYPPARGVDFDDDNDIVNFISFLMERRTRLNIAGLIVFVLGNALGILVIVFHL
jgi:hypothetical protein